MIRLSVIIPGYNTPEAWWERCVCSVLRATGANDEIILVDDGSRAGLKVTEFESFKELDSRIRVITKKNGGLSDARNAALKIARGEYVTFVDSDDEVLPEVYEATIARMAATGSDIGVFEVKTIWPDDGLAKVDLFARSAIQIDGSFLTIEQIRSLSRGCLMNYAWNKVYRQAFLGRNGLAFDVEGMPCEDIIFNLECVMARAKWCTVPILGYLYYRTRGTLLSSYKRMSFRGVRHGVAAWMKLRDAVGSDCDVNTRLWLDARCRLSETELLEIEWRNIWQPGSPFPLLARKRWLNEHPELGGGVAFVRQAIYTFVRRNFYFRFVRRAVTKKNYPYATEWRKDARSP